MNTIAKHMLYYVLLAAVGLCVYLALSGHAQAAVTASQGLEGALADIIQQVSGGVKQGVDFLQAEIPDVIRQLLMWKLAQSLFTILVCVFGVVAFVFAVKACLKHDAENYWSDSIFPVGMFGGIFIFIPSLAGIYCSSLTALQIWIAPKVWLIEYAASLVK